MKMIQEQMKQIMRDCKAKETHNNGSISSETASQTCSNSSISTYYSCSSSNVDNILQHVFLVAEDEVSNSEEHIYHNNSGELYSLEGCSTKSSHDSQEISIKLVGEDTIVHSIKNVESMASKHDISNGLFNEIEHLNWEKVMKRLGKYPKEAQQKVRLKRSSLVDNSKVRTERLPLHHACLKLRSERNSKKLAIRTIMKLVDIYPESCQVRENRHGCLPLHLIAYASSCSWKTKSWRKCKKGRSLMVGVQPGLLEEKENELEVEDILACLVKKMIEAYPKSARIDSEGGRLPLHMAVSGKACIGVIKALLHKYRSTARHRTRDMSLPLHLAATWGVSSADVGIALLQAYPDAALGRNRYDRTPLEEAMYMAGEYGRENQIHLLTVLRKHPTFWASQQGQSITSYQHFKQLMHASHRTMVSTHPPLIHFIKALNWSSVLNRLESHPEEAQSYLSLTSRSGRTIRYSPLHYASEFDPPLKIIETLVHLYPFALSQKSVPGDLLPIHISATYSSPILTSYLLQKLPKAIHCKDELGNLPIHLLCYSSPQFLRTTEEAILDVLSISPQDILATNNAGSTPIDIVSRLNFENKLSLLRILKTKCAFQDADYLENDSDPIDSCTSDLLWV